MEHVVFTDESNMTVEILKTEYRTLAEESVLLDALVKGILQGAKLGWDKTVLTYDDRLISALMAAMFPSSYGTRLADLQKEQEAADKEAADE